MEKLDDMVTTDKKGHLASAARVNVSQHGKKYLKPYQCLLDNHKSSHVRDKEPSVDRNKKGDLIRLIQSQKIRSFWYKIIQSI